MNQITVAQIEVKLLDIKVNEEKIIKTIKKSKEDGSELVIFPEMSLTGYLVEKKHMNEEFKEEVSKSLKRIRGISEELDMDLIISYPRIASKNEAYISSEYISGGVTKDIHDKVYLADYGWCIDHLSYKQGNKMTVLDTRIGRVAILICEDGWHISTSFLAGQLGAEIIIATSATSVLDIKDIEDMRYKWETISKCIGLTQSCYFIYCNRVGQHEDKIFWGGSHIVSPNGRICSRFPMLAEEIRNIEVDSKQVKEMRKISPLIDKERNEFNKKILNQL